MRDEGVPLLTAELDMETNSMVYHTGTQVPGHIGLLVDTGAVFNLTGRGFVDSAAANMKRYINADPVWTKLDTPKAISGVGNDGTNCYQSARICGALASGDLMKYEAPVIDAEGPRDMSYHTPAFTAWIP